jgi:hypothetical protein
MHTMLLPQTIGDGVNRVVYTFVDTRACNGCLCEESQEGPAAEGQGHIQRKEKIPDKLKGMAGRGQLAFVKPK